LHVCDRFNRGFISMGRKGDFHLKPVKGPGRKAKKQKAPIFPKHLQDEVDGKPIGRRAQKRMKQNQNVAVNSVKVKKDLKELFLRNSRRGP
jgi:ribosomal RNA methyltransferase Nop2